MQPDVYTKEINIMPSTIETIDSAMLDWLDKELSIHSTSKEGFKKVPVIWSSAERAYQVKNGEGREIRDDQGILKFPLITLSRDSLSKNPAFKGIAWAHLPQGITVARRIAKGPTTKYKSAYSFEKHSQYDYPNDKNLISYETITMPVPTYVEVIYTVGLKAEYLQQVNEMLSPFITRTGQIDNFFVHKDGHKFEGFIQGTFGHDNNAINLGDQERFYESSVNIRLLAYLIGDGTNADKPKVVIKESPVKIVQMRERIASDEETEFLEVGTVSVKLS